MAKAAGTEPSILPLPSGGGAQRPIDETFQTDLSTGSGYYELPLVLPRGVNDLTPTLGLRYSTGAGNGPFGIGWSIGLPALSRRADRAAPRFGDDGRQDVFRLEGRELTPVGGGVYRQVLETERSIIRYDTAEDVWTVMSGTGVVMHFGVDAAARTTVAAGTLEWHLSRIEDGNGNAIVCTWSREGGRAYLASVRYAIYEVILQYEDRPDSFSSFRSGHEVRTTRRCTSIDLHLTGPAPQLVKSYVLSYTQAAFSGTSLLAEVRLVTIDQPDAIGDPVEVPLEPVCFEYAAFDPASCRMRTFTADAATAPPALTSDDLTLLDLDGVGRPGVIEVHDGSARFWPSLPDLRWGPPRTIPDLPLNADLSDDALRFVDMDGSGTADLLVGSAQSGGYVPHIPGAGWGPMVRYRTSPSAPLATPGVRFVDVDGDNRADVVHSDEHAFYHYLNRGADGWSSTPIVVPRRHRLEEWPDVDLADPHVRFADVVGDGRSHLVVIHDGRVVFYPNLGFGVWGAMRRMAGAPRLPRHYDPSRLFLADIDGDGTADIIYVDFDRVRLWLNRSGNGFSDEIVIRGTPPVATAAVVLADMTGSGTAGVLFSYAASLHRSRDYRYLDLAGGTKPLLLRRITNNRHVTTELTYASSTDWPVDDTDPDLADRPAFLPFPVPVVREMRTTDPATGVVSVSRFAYWNGNYDGASRAFLGFAKAERIDEGDTSVPTNRTVSYFHNNTPLFRGAPRRTLRFGDDGTPVSDMPYDEELVDLDAEVVAVTEEGVAIRRARRTAITRRTFEREAAFDEVHTAFVHDDAGNVTRETVTSRWIDDRGVAREQVRTTQRTYATHPDRGLTALLCRETVWDGNGVVRTDRRIFYDGDPFAGLSLGEVTIGNITRVRDFVMTVAAAQQHFGPAFPDLSTLGYVREDDPVLGDAYSADTFAQRVDARGNLVERRDAVGAATTLQYDAHGLYPVRLTFATGLHLEAEYEYRYGSIARFVDVAGVEQRYRFDAAGRLVGVLRFDDPPDQPYLEYEYFDGLPLAFQVTRTRSEPGGSQHRRIEYFDGLGQTLQVRAEAEDGQVTVTGRRDFNAKGLVSREHQAYFSTSLNFAVDDQVPQTHTEYSYDALGRSVRRVGWHGEVYESTHRRGHAIHADPLDLQAEPDNPVFDTPRTEWHDADGRVVAVLEPHAAGVYVTRYAYDVVGNRTGVEVNGSRFVTNVFDGLGRRIRSDYRDAGMWRYLQDAAGRLVQRIDGKGDVVHRDHDALGRLVHLRHGGADGPVQEEYRYDVGEPGDDHTAGKLTQVRGPFGEVHYTYGPCGCVVAKTRAYPGLPEQLTVRYTTDSLGRYTRVVYPDGAVQDIVYNAGGLIDALPGVISGIGYGPTGRRMRVEFASGVVTDYDYDPASLRLTRLRTTAPDGTTTYQDLAYDYDEVGSVTGIVDRATVPGHVQANRAFGYDALQQLVAETRTGPGGALEERTYGYDRWGNIERYPDQFGADRLLHDDPSLPLRITGVEQQGHGPYAYDDAGNLVRSLHNTYSYDAQNRLVRVESDAGAVTTHQYDHAGNRVISTTTTGGATTTTYTFDDIYTVEGTTTTRIVFDDRSQVALVRSDGTAIVFHKDHVGSHTFETDISTGAPVGEQEYLAFGLPVDLAGLSGSFGFAGKLSDRAHGIVYFGGRYYLPEIGRFLTPDPYFLEQQPDRFFQAPRSLELYVYVLNNPLNMIDPYGLFFGIDDLVVAAIGFVVGVAAYAINTAISGGDFSWSEMLFSGLAGAATLWLTYSTLGVGAAIIVGASMLAKPAVTGALDKAAMGDSFGERLLGFFSFAIKFASSPATSTTGLLIGGFGTGFGLWGDVEWFKGGVLAFEYSPTSPFTAVTLGATVNIWGGSTSDPAFAHELYHSRQYTFFGDAFVPAWLVGGVWGLLSSAIAGDAQWGCFASASASGNYGNPLEVTAHSIEPGGGCT